MYILNSKGSGRHVTYENYIVTQKYMKDLQSFIHPLLYEY